MWFLYQPKSQREINAIKGVFDEGEEIEHALTLLKLRNSEADKKKGRRNFLYINTNSTPFKYFLNFNEELKEL